MLEPVDRARTWREDGPLSPPRQVRCGDLALRVCPPGRVLLLEGPRETSFQLPLLVALGASALPAYGRGVASHQQRLLAITDDSFLLVGDVGAADLRSVAEAAFTVALDVSHAWARLAVEGVNSTALLAKGCAVDFDPSVFPPDGCAATGFAQMRVVIWRSGDEPQFGLMVGRSFARSLWDWLLEAAREYDCTRTYHTDA